jgi:hypothetical protein
MPAHAGIDDFFVPPARRQPATVLDVVKDASRRRHLRAAAFCQQVGTQQQARYSRTKEHERQAWCRVSPQPRGAKVFLPLPAEGLFFQKKQFFLT